MDHEDDLDDPNFDADRYDDAIGWQPTDTYKKQREKVRGQMHRNFNYESMLQTLPANEWRFRRHENAAPPRPLYEDLWLEGELAVLIGPRSSAKSVLAVQLGQEIARGPDIVHSESSFIPHPSPLIPPTVLYIDCQRSRAQWQERYSSLLSPYDTRRVHHRFPRNFRRAALDWDGTVPDEFHGDLGKFLQYSIMQEIDRSGAKIVILDDLTAFCGGSTTPLAVTKAVRLLKLWSVTENLSILVTMIHERNPRAQKRSGKHYSLFTVPYSLSAADSVFAISPSTFAPDIRYVKHLTSPRPITHDASNVLTYRLERSENAFAAVNGKRKTVNDPNTSSLTTNHSPLSITASFTTNHSPFTISLPFLALTPLGPSEERDHLRDYAAEAAQAQLAHERQLKKLHRRSGREILVDGVLDGSYMKYLKGE